MKPTTFLELQKLALKIPEYGIDVYYKRLVDGTPCGEKCGYYPHNQKPWYSIKNFIVSWGNETSEYVFPVYSGIIEILKKEGYKENKNVYVPFFYGAVPEEYHLRQEWKNILRKVRN